MWPLQESLISRDSIAELIKSVGKRDLVMASIYGVGGDIVGHACVCSLSLDRPREETKTSISSQA
jgi:hypothetical protein